MSTATKQRKKILLKTITLTQPWASLIALGEKKIETRSWKSAYRGVIAIHASSHIPVWVKTRVLTDPSFGDAFARHEIESLKSLPLGTIVAMGIMKECKPTSEMIWNINETERHFGDYSPGRFAFVLEQIVPIFDFARVTGKLGLWNLEIPLNSVMEDLYLYLNAYAFESGIIKHQ